MPVPTETFRNMKKLNVVFGLSALAGLVSFGWMMWHDYDRDWRHTQTGFFNARSALAHFTALSFESDAERKRHEALAAAVQAAEGELERPDVKPDIDKARQDKINLKGRLEGVALAYGNRNAELSVTLFKYEEALALHGPDDPRTTIWETRFKLESQEAADLKKEQDKLEDALRDVDTRLKTRHAKLTAAQKELDAYNKRRDDAVKRDRMFGPGPTRAIINLPILDAFPPKGVPGRQEVRQVFMPPIRFDYNFIDSYVTDRCMTCHVSIDDPLFTRENFVEQASKALETDKVREILRQENEKLARGLDRRLAEVDTAEFRSADLSPAGDAAVSGPRVRFINAFVHAANVFLEETKRPPVKSFDIQRRLKDKALDRGTVQSAIEQEARKIFAAAPPRASDKENARELRFEEMNAEQQERHFKSLSAAMNLYLVRMGRPEVAFNKEYEAHPRLDLFLSPESPHPLNKMGCTVCHEGSGQDTDFVLAAHTPKNPAEKKEWAKKYYVKEAGLPLATFHLVEEYWERPMLLPKYVSASCVKCHDRIYDLERHKAEPLDAAHNVVEGRTLFTQVGCINCHNVEGLTGARQVGTDLTYVADKLSAGFMERWIQSPEDFRPATRMPHFFRQENNLDASRNEEFDPTPELRTEAEIKAIAHYLRVFSRPFDAKPLPEGLTGDPKRGEELFLSVGCLACHANLDAHDPLDSAGRTFGEKWIATDIAHVKAEEKLRQLIDQGERPSESQKQEILDGLAEEAKQIYAGMSQNDRTRYAARRFTTERREKATLARKTEIFLADNEQRDPDPLKTYVPPDFSRHAPELTGMGTKLAPDASNAEQMRRGMQWLYNWLSDPRHYSSYSNMPRMFRDNYYQDLSPDQRKLKNDQDMLDVAAYLLTLRNESFETDPVEDTPEHRAEMERLILMLLGGQNTETVSKMILGDQKMDPSEPYGPLTRAVVNQAYRSFGGGDAGREKVAALINERSGSLADRQRLYFGMKMISHYGCYGCHKIAGFEDATPVGTDLSLWAQKFMSQLDFAFFSHVFEHEREENPEVWGSIYRPDEEYAHLRRATAEAPDQLMRGVGEPIAHEMLHNHAAFAYHKMRNPRIYDREKYKKPYEKLKMPNFYFTEREARALTTFLLSRRAANVQASVKIAYEGTPTGIIADGRPLVRELNCIGCHTIEGGDEATIHQYYTDDITVADDFPFGVRFRPPLLWGEGAKIQHDWLYSFLNNVEMLRPWMNARMPSFHLTGEQATALVEYFAGLSQDESKILREELMPIAKHLQQVHAAAGGVEGEPAEVFWFTEEKLAAQAEFLKRYGLAHQQVVAANFQPSATPQMLAPTYQKLVQRAGFLSSLYDIEYPFPGRQFQPITEERFNTGLEFFYDLKCLACHVGGDPTVPGTTTDIKAPNFALAHKRLSYDWVMYWLQDPGVIMPGTNMPQIFPGTTFHDQFGGDMKKEGEAKYGDTVEKQATLLTDFIFALGERGFTAIQPGALEQQEQQPPEQGEMEFDFGGGGGESEAEGQGEAEPEFDFGGGGSEEKKKEEPEFDFESPG